MTIHQSGDFLWRSRTFGILGYRPKQPSKVNDIDKKFLKTRQILGSPTPHAFSRARTVPFRELFWDLKTRERAIFNSRAKDHRNTLPRLLLACWRCPRCCLRAGARARVTDSPAHGCPARRRCCGSPAVQLLDLPGLRISSDYPGSFPARHGSSPARCRSSSGAAAADPASACVASVVLLRFPLRPGPTAARLPPEAKRRSETLYAPVLYNLKGYNITRARVYYIQDIYYRARKGVSVPPLRLPLRPGPAAAGLRCCRSAAAPPMGPGYFSLAESEAQRAAIFPACALCACIYLIAAENDRFRRFVRFVGFA